MMSFSKFEWTLLGILVIILIAIISMLAILFFEESTLTQEIERAGLEIVGLRTLQNNELPPGAESGQHFVLPTHCGDCGGKIIVFANDSDAGKMAELWRGMNQHVYVKDGVLLQINGRVEKIIADRYGEVLLR